MSDIQTAIQWELRHKATDAVVQWGESVEDFKGTPHRITGGRPPHKPSSEGAVRTLSGFEYYPSVFDLKWVSVTVAPLGNNPKAFELDAPADRTPASQAMYLDEGGQRCPFCGSHSIEGKGVNVDAGIAWQTMTCNDCASAWQDDYKLVGYTAAQ